MSRGCSRSAISRGCLRHAAPCARHGTARHCYYLVPLNYLFTSLLRRVHDYLAICGAQRDYMSAPPLATMAHDASYYRLPCTSTDVIFECDALSRVLQFIDANLSPRIRRSCRRNRRQRAPVRLVARLSVSNNSTSCGSSAPRTRSIAAAGQLEAAAAFEQNLECCVTCVFYFVSLPESITALRTQISRLRSPSVVAAPMGERPQRRPPSLMARRHDSTTEDDENLDDDDDDSSINTDTVCRRRLPLALLLLRSTIAYRWRACLPPYAARRIIITTTPLAARRVQTSMTRRPRVLAATARHSQTAACRNAPPPTTTVTTTPRATTSRSATTCPETPRRHTMPPQCSPSMLLATADGNEKRVSPPLASADTANTATTNNSGSNINNHSSQRTPRTDSPSEQNSRLLQSVTTGSRSGFDSSDAMAQEELFDRAPIPPARSPPPPPTAASASQPAAYTEGTFGTPVPVSNTPYAPILHHARAPPPAPLSAAAANSSHAATSAVKSAEAVLSNGSRSGSSEQTTQFRISSSEGTANSTETLAVAAK